MQQLEKARTLLSALIIGCSLLVTEISNAIATPNYPCACAGMPTIPAGVILSVSSDKFTANGVTITGTCDTANNYYGSCSAPAGAATINTSNRSAGCTITGDTITYSCNGSNWVASTTCGNSRCDGFDYGGRGDVINGLNSGSSAGLNCGSGYHRAPIYYCRNGVWSYTDGDGSGTSSAGVCAVN